MTFEEILDAVLAILQRRGRVTYRTLKRQYHLDDDAFEDLKDELLYAHPHAVADDGRGLVWTGELRPTPAPGRSPVIDQVRAPLAYTPTYLAEKILTSKTALEGERKQVTVLFADLKGSLELLADRHPEEARALLDPVLERLMATVHRYEGTVNQVMGDGIMALFGAPIAHEDHAVRACYAALAMQEAIRRYSEEVRRTQGVEVHIRVGLNSGEVVVRAIGSDLHMDYSAIGQTTHLTARMEQLAPPGTIRLTAETLRLAEGLIQVQALGPVPVKGLTAPVEVFELVAAGSTRRRLQAAAARGLTRFVGRQHELEAVRQALERARTGHGQVVAVVGEPGVGKSRLLWEFVHSHHTQAWYILESSSVSYGKATPYLPVIDLLKAYCQIEARDDARRIREKLIGKVLTLDRALEPNLPAVLALLDVPVEDRAWQALDPPQRRQRTQDAIKRLLLRESQEQPLLLVFEDLHWIDAETQGLLDSLVDSLPTACVLLLVNYRPEYRHGWGQKSYYTQLRLDPLPPEGADAMLQNLLGDDPGLAALKQHLIASTDGNPFFLEESVRSLIETGELVGERGTYRLAKPRQGIQVPATVQAILPARIDRLQVEDKRLLQTAAVIGDDVPLALLQAIAELPEEALHRGLAHLQTAEFLYETCLFPEPEYTFKHALTHEVAYGSLLQERRRTFHARILAALEALYPDRLVEQVERLAHHALRGEIWPKAVHYCRQAGLKAYSRSAHREAAAYLEQALAALTHLPESRDTREQAIDLRFDLRRALVSFGEFGRILDLLREADTLAMALDDPHRLGWIAASMTQYFTYQGDYDGAIAAGQRALALAATSGDVQTQLEANFYLGAAYHSLGEYGRAMGYLRQNLTTLEGDMAGDRFSLPSFRGVTSRSFLAWCLTEVGAFAEGIAWGEEGVRIAETVDHPYSLAAACVGAGLVYLRQGDLARAMPLLERGLGLCQEADLLLFFPRLASALGLAYTLSGRLEEGLSLLQHAVEQSASMGITALHALWLVHLAEGYRLAGRLDDAMLLAVRALELAQTFKERGHQAYALRLLGEIAAQHDPPEGERAQAHYRQALVLAEELGMRPLQAHCHRGLGALYAKVGPQDQARAELSIAIALYRSMEMTFWLHQAEAALGQVEGK